MGCSGEGRGVEAGESGGVLHMFVGEAVPDDAVHHFFRARQRRTRGKLDDGDDVILVDWRHEAFRRDIELNAGKNDKSGIHRQHHGRKADELADETRVAL